MTKMTTRQRLENLLKKLPSSSDQGGLASNSELKFHKRLVYNGEVLGNVWAIWCGGLEPETIGNAQDLENELREEITHYEEAEKLREASPAQGDGWMFDVY